jgi:hypothetical protein
MSSSDPRRMIRAVREEEEEESSSDGSTDVNKRIFQRDDGTPICFMIHKSVRKRRDYLEKKIEVCEELLSYV